MPINVAIPFCITIDVYFIYWFSNNARNYVRSVYDKLMYKFTMFRLSRTVDIWRWAWFGEFSKMLARISIQQI